MVMACSVMLAGIFVSSAFPETPNQPAIRSSATAIATEFPNASNTGVPDKTRLAEYSGPMTITANNTVIDSKLIRGELVIAAKNVTVRRSKLIGNIRNEHSDTSVTIVDSEIDGGRSFQPAVGYDNITMTGVNVHGARVSVLCGSNCLIENSWLHGQYLKPDSGWHVDGYLSNGGENVVLRNNTLECEPQGNASGGGCTAPAASFGDFAPLRNITFDGNLFVATPGSYCLYGGHNPDKPHGANPTMIVIKNNVFQRGHNRKCGIWGAVTSFNRTGNGNIFLNNTWNDGLPLYR